MANGSGSSIASDSTRESKMTSASTSASTATTAPLQHAMRSHAVSAKVIDVDHYQKGLMTVDTDYIIEVQSSSADQPFTYMISKTYHQFRSLCGKFKEASEMATAGVKTAREFSKPAKFVVKYVDAVCKVIESEPVEYFAKVSYNYVKKLSLERSRRLSDALEMILLNFPDSSDADLMAEPGVRHLIKHIEAFFLTDHVIEEGKEIPEYLKATSTTSSKHKDKNHKDKDRKDKDKDKSKPKVSASTATLKTGNTTAPTTAPTPTTATKAATATTASSPITATATTTPTRPVKSSLQPNRPPSSISMKTRRSLVLRQKDSAILQEMGSSRGGLTLEEDDAGGKSKGKQFRRGKNVASKKATSDKGISMVFAVPLLAVLLVFLKRAQLSVIHIDADYAALACFMCFAFGVQLSNTYGLGKSADSGCPEADNSTELSGRGVKFSESVEVKLGAGSQSLALLRKSMSGQPTNLAMLQSMAEDEDGVLVEEEDGDSEGRDDEQQPRALIQSPLKNFPPNGHPDEDLNCVSAAPSTDFPVRGPKYLTDHKKIPSAPMLFPSRGADLLLTDECPENVGRSSAILGGKLREKPTFLINFRLPWGVLIFFYEIPEKFLPYVQKRYDPTWENKEVPDTDNMTPSERCVARFLMGDDEHKKQSLKILPKVVHGPWIVKSVVGTTPAIIGNKLPVNYVYQAPDEAHGKALYLEADLDIVASSAARKILGVVRSYTQGLTIDLGFLIEGKQPDELPEQMLVGTRIHGLDPLNASLLPPMPHDFLAEEDEEENGSQGSGGTNR